MSYDPTYRDGSGDDQDHAKENADDDKYARMVNDIRAVVVDTLSRNFSMVEPRMKTSMGLMYEKSDIEKMIHAAAANLAMVITELVNQ